MTEQLTERKNGPKYPDVSVQLVGVNAYVLLGKVSRALYEAGVEDGEITEFQREAMSDDYNYLLFTIMRWVDTH